MNCITWEQIARGYEFAVLSKKVDVNYLSRDARNFIRPNDVGMDEFNRLYFYVKGLGLPRLVRTKSCGISIDRKKFYGRGWDVKKTRTYVELLVVINAKYWRILFKNPTGRDEESVISGTTSFREFCKELAADGIDIEDLAIENGMDVKQEIESPLISLYSDTVKHKVWDNAHHIDFHSSHPAGMANYYPVLRPTIERIYAKKEEAPKDSYKRKLYKAILNSTWGYLQAEHVGARWAHIARDAIHDTNNRLYILASKLIAAGRRILAFNTDGIWYVGEIYHGEGEGPGLGQWGHDHLNCRIRFKSAGIYEFIEGEEYTAVVRGYTRLDQIKNRTEWGWGDIYVCGPYIYKFSEEKGVYKDEYRDD